MKVSPLPVNPLPQGKTRPGAVPSMDTLLVDPTVFNVLPVEVQDVVYEQIAALEAALRSKVLTRSSNGQAPARNEPDRAVRLEEACTLLGMERTYLERRENWQKLGGYKDDDVHIKFAMSVIQRHIHPKAPR